MSVNCPASLGFFLWWRFSDMSLKWNLEFLPPRQSTLSTWPYAEGFAQHETGKALQILLWCIFLNRVMKTGSLQKAKSTIHILWKNMLSLNPLCCWWSYLLSPKGIWRCLTLRTPIFPLMTFHRAVAPEMIIQGKGLSPSRQSAEQHMKWVTMTLVSLLRKVTIC